MGRFGLALKTFWQILTSAEAAARLADSGNEPARIEESKAASPPQPVRSDALTLLEAFQREARLIDFLKEDLSEYDDSQVGAAVREVHRGSQDVLNRYFAISPVVNEDEGTRYEVTTATKPTEVKLVGNVVEARPVKGALVHAGWRAGKCELPQWSGSEEDAYIIALAEVELA